MSIGLVIENDPTDDVRRLGEWLTAAGLELETLRPYAGQALPEGLDGYAALVVLGGDVPGAGSNAGAAHAYGPGEPWFAACESLLRRAVRDRVPTLGICLGAQLLATAHGGTVAPAVAGPERGPALVARRDAAESDPLFARVPFTPDVIQWHHDEIVELPARAVLLAASLRYPVQAFRVGPVAWGLQFHIEADPQLVAGWAAADSLPPAVRPEQLVAAAEAVMDDIAEAWQPFAARFAALARGELAIPRPNLPLHGA